jgi:hypothetical protein
MKLLESNADQANDLYEWLKQYKEAEIVPADEQPVEVEQAPDNKVFYLGKRLFSEFKIEQLK